MEIKIVKDYEELSEVAAQKVSEVLNSVENPVLGLATGSTPIGLYENLIKLNKEGLVDFSDVTSVNLDEYLGLEQTHPQSYRQFMNERLFNHVNIDLSKTYIPDGATSNPERESLEYEKLIAQLGPVDLQILGIGTNGHIGFNEPAEKLSMVTHVVDLEDSTINANKRFFERVEDVPIKAITMGVGTIMKAKQIIVLASGISKADIIKSVADNFVTTEIPATLLKFHPNVLVIVDEDAAIYLK